MRKAARLFCGGLIVTLICGSVPAQEAPEKEAAKPDKAAAAPESKPATHKVTEGPFRIEIKMDGVFESTRMHEVLLRPESWSSLVIERAVPHGQQVKRGEPLIWLETEKLDDQLKTAETSLKQAQMSLQDGEADLKVLEETYALDMKVAKRALDDAQEDLDYFVTVRRPRSERSAKFSLQNSRWQLEYAEEELNQLEKMYEADDLTEETEEIVLKRARRSVESSKNYLETSEISFERTMAKDLPRQLEQYTEALERQKLSWERSQVTVPNGLTRKRMDVEKLREAQRKATQAVAKLKRDRKSMTLLSPGEGVVYYGGNARGKWTDASKLAAKLRPGGSLTPNSVVMTIVALRPMQVRFDLAEKSIEYIRRGTRAEVTPTSFPKVEIPASLAKIPAIPLGPGVFDCTLRLDEKEINPRVVPGMNCQVTLVPYDKEKAITVPPAAIFKTDAGKDCVYVVKKDEPEQRTVTVGKRSDGKAEILRGLKAGEEILLKKPNGDAK